MAKYFVTGISMLEPSNEEAPALRLVSLTTKTRAQVYGAWHEKNIKKIGHSKAKYVPQNVCVDSMPTPRAAAAYQDERSAEYDCVSSVFACGACISM